MAKRCCLRLFVITPQLSLLKKSCLAGSDVPDDGSGNWNDLWFTFWGKSSSEYIVEKSVRLPDERTLKASADDEMRCKYLTLPQ